jgi:hypothetical protein
VGWRGSPADRVAVPRSVLPFQRERYRYSLTDPIFAAAFETCNLRQRWDATSRSTRWSASLRNRVLAIVCFAALGFWLITLIER